MHFVTNVVTSTAVQTAQITAESRIQFEKIQRAHCQARLATTDNTINPWQELQADLTYGRQTAILHLKAR